MQNKKKENRNMKTPLELIKKGLADEIPSELLCKLPVKWEKVGNVLIKPFDIKD